MHMKIHFMLFFNPVFIFPVHYATMYKDINGGMTHETHKKIWKTTFIVPVI